MRRPLIAGNWKMYKTPSEAEKFAQELKSIDIYKERDILVCVPFPAILSVSRVLSGTSILVGAQNMYPAKEGAYTGEVSPLMIKDSGASFVICGHSERRQIFKETDDFIAEKVKAALDYEITPILCVGETLQENEAGETFSVIERQLRTGLKFLSGNTIEKIVIAYEPVWAIGTGKNATPQQAQDVHRFIRKLIEQNYGQSASCIRILYGGSVKPENIDILMAEADIDGALVGGASLKIESFSRIVGFQRI
ncbi:MAG TPA: triose-phosphate isomerase [Candidatus Ratteibacteria bacterium]|jgi:triosephosphate isomerase|uniref:Triosephosphate isomerase n=1 Tax=candidate division TA06 bacterium ADurb.Bin131 TaxID=1852827 RepID=A0A1V6CD94_UNCT6|nr:MAG: Bifunctional PGK [candidate division TA06 bacterium ADurb.Bin131]HOC03198.1 triose-phosphate isomerase [bacterium]HRS06760.1 triose-phosphate isomerase [Candidatus Ratteibacteria bacterium]HON06116.1 triose-phosphate isomerase [bacterium]HOQ81952.1 triose-phosphate isomerase [bacterium]